LLDLSEILDCMLYYRNSGTQINSYKNIPLKQIRRYLLLWRQYRNVTYRRTNRQTMGQTDSLSHYESTAWVSARQPCVY